MSAQKKPGPHLNRTSVQAKLLDKLSEDVGAMPQVYDNGQRHRDMHQKALNDMVEDALRHIQKARGHVGQQARMGKDTVTSYSAKFEHDINSTREALRHDLAERTVRIEEVAAELEGRMDKLEADLATQQAFREGHCEEILGPLRDDVLRLGAGLEAERRARRGEEVRREKLLNDEVEAMTQLIEAEKFERGRQLAEFERWAANQEELLAKRQHQGERATQDTVRVYKQELEVTAQERIKVQHRVIDSIASFVKRYHEQLAKDQEEQLAFIAGQSRAAAANAALDDETMR